MKKASQENFPVASFFFRSKERKIISDYYNFARYCDDIADNPTLSKKEKLQALNEAEQSLYNKASLSYGNILHNDLVQEKIDFSVAADLLIAFRQDAENISYETWAQLLEYCKYSAAPVGRFMLALYDENPSTYLPAAALCSVLQLVNHIQDLKNDVTSLKRIYIPAEVLKKHKVSVKALSADKCSKNLHFLINDVLNRCFALLKDARVLPAIIKNTRLKIYVCITLKLTDILINKLYNKDILAEKVRLSYQDKVKACVLGVVSALTTKRKTLTNKEL